MYVVITAVMRGFVTSANNKHNKLLEQITIICIIFACNTLHFYSLFKSFKHSLKRSVKILIFEAFHTSQFQDEREHCPMAHSLQKLKSVLKQF